MTQEQAKEQFQRFLGDDMLTFSVDRYGSSGEEWVARCNEIPAISTSGFGFDDRTIRETIKDAIVTAAGIDGEYTDEVLRDVSITNQMTLRQEIAA